MKNLDKDKIFILTDSCAWEANRLSGNNRSEHIIEVVDAETGQIRWIASGSKISFVEGSITTPANQEDYNNQKHEEETSKNTR